MIKVLVAALLGTVVGIVVMVVVIVASGSETSNSSSVGLNPTVSTAAISTPASSAASTPSSSGGGSTGGTTGATGAGDATAGKAVFASNGCGSCHTLSVAGASGTLGPNLGTAVAGDAQKANMPLAAFIKQSITDPAAYIASGGPWATPMPTSFGSSLSATQIDDLVALIVSGQGK